MDTTDPCTPEHLQGLDAPVTALLGQTGVSKRALAHVEAPLPELHTHLSNAAGWCEVFCVPKRHVTPELHAFLTARERGLPIPETLAQEPPAEVVLHSNLPRQYHKVIFHTVKLRPCVRSRWREDAHTSTISLRNDSPSFSFTPQGVSHLCEKWHAGDENQPSLPRPLMQIFPWLHHLEQKDQTRQENWYLSPATSPCMHQAHNTSYFSHRWQRCCLTVQN